MPCGAVIPAAGSASRFGEGDKTLVGLAGRPVLEWVLQAMLDSESLEQIVIVVSPSNQAEAMDLIVRMRSPVPISAVHGGERRMDSVKEGVDALGQDIDMVLVHDAARPLVSPRLVRTVIEAACQYGAAIPGIPVTDTVKKTRGNQVVETLDRRELIAVQTPQVFRRDWLEAAYREIPVGTELTDEASVLEAAGYPVRVVPGDPANLKVTTPMDTRIAEAMLYGREATA